ncbi:MAG: hypothetical protein K6G15_03000 [Desulfovibrio sp.]|nr:hypothetical protein [Desulfovibrio sp.]
MNNEPLMSAYEMAEKARLDAIAHQRFCEKKGEKKERSRWVLNLLDSGMTPNQIAEKGKLPLSEVEAIAASRKTPPK